MDHDDPHKLQLLGRMAGSVAHDINNLLAVIDGYGHMLQRQLSDYPALQDKIAAILQAAERGTALTRRLLDFRDQKSDTLSGCDLTALTNNNRVLLKPVLSSRIELTCYVPPHEIMVPLPADQMTQIMIGCCLSARRRQATQVTIAVTQTRDRIFFTVKDNGPEPIDFSQDDLRYAAECMMRCGGRLDHYSHRQNGNEITAVFPLQQTGNDALRDKTILVVDDEEELLPVLEDQLRAMGLKVLKAANATTAMLMQQSHPDKIDFLLTDVVMPGTDGVRLAEILSRQSPEMGVVYMTGYAGRRETQDLPDSALVLPKPLRPESISSALRHALEQVQDI